MVIKTLSGFKLVADEGMVYTDGKKIFGKMIFLPNDNSIYNFHEISEEEAKIAIEKIEFENFKNLLNRQRAQVVI